MGIIGSFLVSNFSLVRLTRHASRGTQTASGKKDEAAVLRAHKNSLFAAYYIDSAASTGATRTLVTPKVIPETHASDVNSGRIQTARFSCIKPEMCHELNDKPE
jgi:hypothetical protein